MAELSSFVPLVVGQQAVQHKGVGGYPSHHLSAVSLPQHALAAGEAAQQCAFVHFPVHQHSMLMTTNNPVQILYTVHKIPSKKAPQAHVLDCLSTSTAKRSPRLGQPSGIIMEYEESLLE